MLKRSMLSLCALAALVLAAAGCGAQQGETRLTYLRGKDLPSMATADKTGTYALYPSQSFNPLGRVELTRGDQYGFSRRGEKVVGMARDQEFPLEAYTATAYYWKYQGRK